jgi:hypothetical protein
MALDRDTILQNYTDLSCAHVAEFERAYKHWFKHYLSSPDESWGIYRPSSGNLVLQVFVPVKHRGGFTNCILDGMKRFTFFPHTRIQTNNVEFASDWDALLNDWVMVGSDLYEAMRECKIASPRVNSDSRASEPTATAR